MNLVSEAKALLKATKDLEHYAGKIHAKAKDVEWHSAKYEAAVDDKTKEKHLKHHVAAFTHARKLKELHDQLVQEIELHMERIERLLNHAERG